MAASGYGAAAALSTSFGASTAALARAFGSAPKQLRQSVALELLQFNCLGGESVEPGGQIELGPTRSRHMVVRWFLIIQSSSSGSQLSRTSSSHASNPRAVMFDMGMRVAANPCPANRLYISRPLMAFML